MVESQAAILERRLITQLIWAIAVAPTDEMRMHSFMALLDLVQHVDPSLDVSKLDSWTRRCLRVLLRSAASEKDAG